MSRRYGHRGWLSGFSNICGSSRDNRGARTSEVRLSWGALQGSRGNERPQEGRSKQVEREAGWGRGCNRLGRWVVQRQERREVRLPSGRRPQALGPMGSRVSDARPRGRQVSPASCSPSSPGAGTRDAPSPVPRGQGHGCLWAWQTQEVVPSGGCPGPPPTPPLALPGDTQGLMKLGEARLGPRQSAQCSRPSKRFLGSKVD